jgi:hypothetical protein
MAKVKRETYLPLLEKYELDGSAVWDCHGSPTLYHWACEHIGSRLSIEFHPPEVIHNDNLPGSQCTIVLLVAGSLPDSSSRIWTFAEVNPKNNKMDYPWAMVEKRGKDRLILKLAGLHGRLYAQSEMEGRGDGSILDPGEPQFRDAADFSVRMRLAFVAALDCASRDEVIDYTNGLLAKYDAKSFLEVQPGHWLDVAVLMRQQVEKWRKQKS